MNLEMREHATSADAFSDRDWHSLEAGHRRFSDPDLGIAPASELLARRRQVLLTGSRPYRICSKNGYFEFDENPPARLRPTIDSIVSLCALSANWDSYGGRPLDPWRAAAAISLLLEITTANTPLPCVVPTNRGGVQFEWHCNDVDLEIEVASPTKYVVEFEDLRQGTMNSLVLTGNMESLGPLLKRLSQVI